MQEDLLKQYIIERFPEEKFENLSDRQLKIIDDSMGFKGYCLRAAFDELITEIKEKFGLNYQVQNDTVVVSSIHKKVTIVDGIEYPWRKEMMGRSCTTINSKVYIDGFELKQGKWKRTLKALWYLIF